jgi:folate-binding protein YgfZ
MHDNPQASEGALFALPDHRVVSLSGRDAVAFAQAQFMNDVAGLASGHWQWSGWLTPKGRVLALFALLHVDAETLLLVVPDADPAAFAAALQRFVFRSKVVIAVREDLYVEAAFAAPARARGARLDGDPGQGIELDVGGEQGPRTLRIVSTGSAAGDAAAQAAWAAFDLAHGLPRLPASQADRWTPQQLSLERLGAFSVKKGCYPGQEIVARTHFLGKAKRGLALFEGEGPGVAPGGMLTEGAQAVGEIVSTANGLALGVLGLEQARDGLQAGGTALRPHPLRAGLAR